MSTFPIVHVWSDIACPFCYIGKKRLLQALPSDAIIRWHSFVLQPNQVTNPSITLHQFLAQSKGWSEAQTIQIQQEVTAMAAKDGLTMHMDKVIPANTIQAHLLIQMHANRPSATTVVERLFKAYFEEGLNVDDPEVLKSIHLECGGDEEQWSMREHPQWRKDLEKDLQQAAQMGIRGVPFTYFEDHFTISGAREPIVFEQAVAQLSAI
jgi:predicted DsbA family dithiol-disulfide isomerase